MTTHSPAPWTLDGGQVLDRDGNVLASVPYTLGDAQDHANGRLIVAAPELMAACKAARIVVTLYLSEYPNTVQGLEAAKLLDAAMAKAEREAQR